MSLENFLDGLDDEQKLAVTLKNNGVVTAGAGSGKTRVLASRYVWLILNGYSPGEILTLTFTNKAVSEMYSRIYRYLLDSGDPAAEEALKNFHKAQIGTLDSFSANIARTAAARYGIAPEFKTDDVALKKLSREAALQFVLDHREAYGIRHLLPDHKIRKLAEEIFSEFVLKYSPVSKPLDLDEYLLRQKTLILNEWKEKSGLMEEAAAGILDSLSSLDGGKSYKFMEPLSEIFLENPLPAVPDIGSFLDSGIVNVITGEEINPAAKAKTEEIRKYFDFYSPVTDVRLPGKYDESYSTIIGYLKSIKGKDRNGLYQKLESIANYALNFGIIAGIFELLKKFQGEFNLIKRERGLLSFNDIARLAVDALKDHPDIRRIYKDSFKMIMIDEFQDNNALQRDLVYLLAEKSSRMEKGIPGPEDLEANRMFFVGDEKQSIYRFRGADVAVFRTLGLDLFGQPGNGNITLIHNYRSKPGLVAAFNLVFSGVFASSRNGVLQEIPDYEAVYSPIYPPAKDGSEDAPLVHLCFLNGDELPDDDSGGIKARDLEAVFIAEKIRSMVDNKTVIYVRKDNGMAEKSCSWGDFTVLERTYTHQYVLEKYFREFGIPYNTDRPSGLFNDAPILDMRAYLRLLVYPEDRLSYAALIRSPFMRLSDLSLAVCLLSKNPEPFAEENADLVPKDELELYRRAGEHYRALREASRVLSVTELITKLWFDEGYRHETLWSQPARVYESLFDLFFSLASDCDIRGYSLADFVEYLEDVISKEDKPDDRDIPGEAAPGVRIMSIHKAKGLEFPLVFIFDCTNAGNLHVPPGLIDFHEQYGPVLNIPQAEELIIGGNYFREIMEEEEKAKDTAELKRLLYVAMTRAECGVYLTFTLPRQTKEEKKHWDINGLAFNDMVIRQRLSQLEEKTKDRRDTFLKLLLPVITECPSSLFTFESIPVLNRAEIAGLAAGSIKTGTSAESFETPLDRQRKAALAAKPYYEKAEVFPGEEDGYDLPGSIDASRLHYKSMKEKTESSFLNEGIKDIEDNDDIMETGLNPAEFGSLVHAVLEAKMNDDTIKIPRNIRSRIDNDKTIKKLEEKALAKAETFLHSELGKCWALSKYRESEFSIITAAAVEGKMIAIIGKMDLLFEEESGITVVDFKTDRTENPEDHYGQLAAYYRAAGDIFNRSVSIWLFYLRSGNAVNVTEEIKKLSLEEITANTLLPGNRAY